MTLTWTRKAVDDLARLHDFLAAVNPVASVQVVQALTAAVGHLLEHPRLGEKLQQYEPREVRRLLVGRYEMRYEVRKTGIVMLRLWHTREDR